MRRSLTIAGATVALLLLLAAPAHAGDRDMAPGAGVHLGMTILETGYDLGAGIGLLAHAGTLGHDEGRRFRTSGGLLLGSAAVHSIRLGLAAELLHTSVRTGWEPTRWRAGAAILSGSLHLLDAGLALGGYASAQLTEAEMGRYECVIRVGCGGAHASPVGTVLLIEAGLITMSLPYTIVEMIIGIEAAKRLQPRSKRREGFVMNVSPTGLFVSGRF